MAFLNGTSVLKLDLLELLFSRDFIVLLYASYVLYLCRNILMRDDYRETRIEWLDA